MRVRVRHRSSIRARQPRAISLSEKGAKLRVLSAAPPDDGLVFERPRTRGECAPYADGQDAQRPCPWVSCRHHLYLEVDHETGSLKLVFPELEPSELTESCSLDIADRGDHTLDQVGERINVTRERARQIEVRAQHHAKQAAVLVEFAA